MGAQVHRFYRPVRARTVSAMVAIIACLGVAGCGLFSHEGSEDLNKALDTSMSSDRAMSALTKGDFATAESLAQDALKDDPKDPYALLVAGLAYERSDHYDLARQYFKVLITNRPSARIAVPDASGDVHLRPVVEIAQANLDKIDRLSGRTMATSIAESGHAPGTVMAVSNHPMDADANAVTRFRVLKQLLDEDLITPDEYNQRRQANSGILLPMTGTAPSVGLDRPVPEGSQLVDRLRMLKTAVESREMLPREAAAERLVILEALLPAQPKNKAVPPLPPKDVLELAEAVGRLEKLKSKELISSDEMNKERAALDQALDKEMSMHPVLNNNTGLQYGHPPMSVPAMPTQMMMASQSKATPKDMSKIQNWGVVLGVTTDEEEGKVLAAQIKSKFPEELGAKVLSVRKVTLKGVDKWQIVTASDNKDAARRLCKTMRLHRQSCEAAAL